MPRQIPSYYTDHYTTEIDYPGVITDWCRKKQGEGILHLDNVNSTKTLFRFTTPSMDEYIPAQDNDTSGWRNGRFYYYEIVLRHDCLFVMLSFSNTHAPVEIREAVRTILSYAKFRGKKENWVWRTIWTSEEVPVASFNNENDVVECLDKIVGNILMKEEVFFDTLKKGGKI